jgi:hypothetical protein
MSDMPAFADVVGGDCGALRIEFDRGQTPAGFAQPETDPDGAVAVGAADFERALGAARHDHEAQEPAVLLRDGELLAVDGP